MLRTIFLYYLFLALALLGCTNIASAEPWQQLGSYSLLNPAGLPTSRFLQISVSESGKLRGTLFDGIRGASLQLHGRIDPRTEQAEWRLDEMPQVRFRTTLYDLTQTDGVVQIVQPGGQQESWRITRQDNWR